MRERLRFSQKKKKKRRKFIPKTVKDFLKRYKKSRRKQKIFLGKGRKKVSKIVSIVGPNEKKIRYSFFRKRQLSALRKKTRTRFYIRRWRTRLLGAYSVPLYVRFQHNNLFLSVFDRERQNMVHKTVGQLDDYTKSKKKKKTYMAGFEFGYLVQDMLHQTKVKTLSCGVHGHGAHFKGFYQGMVRKENIRFVKFRQLTRLAHGGTRATRKRRL